MSVSNLILIGVAAAAIAAALAAFVIAFRRSADWRGAVSAETRAADRSRRARREPARVAASVTTAPASAAAGAVEAEPSPAHNGAVPPEVTVEVVQRVVEVSPEEAGVTRRQFFNRALGATFFSFLGLLGLDVLAFLWPKLTGGFGSDVNVGPVQDLLDQAVNDDGSITPVFIPEARAYVVPAPDPVSAQFEGVGVVAGGVMALWQRCVHLGCRVPWCAPSQGFECPCHGSKYSAAGEYFAGPAPRNLDRFVLELTDGDELVIKTGSVVQTPRALQLSARYPQGPSCI